MSDGFLNQDLESKLFKWFEGRLDASQIKRSNEMKLFRVTDGREVVVGDPVKFMGRPHYIESITDKLVFVTSMCERKYYFACKPEEIDCKVGACAEVNSSV